MRLSAMKPPARFVTLMGLLTGLALLLVAEHLVPFGLPQVWTWLYLPLGAPRRILFPIIAAGGLLVVITRPLARLLTEPPTAGREWRALLSLWAATTGMALGVALMHPSGFMRLTTLIINPASNSYFTTALQHPDTRLLLDHYETKMAGFVSHAQTQAAGPVVLSAGLLRLLAAVPGTQDIADTLLALSPGVNSEYVARAAARWWHVSVSAQDASAALLIAIILICGGSLAVIPIYFLGKELYNPATGVYAAVGFALLPCFYCFTPSIDQLYPFVTASALCLVLIAARCPQRAWLWLGLTGLGLGLAIFMSLGLATLVPFSVLFWLCCKAREPAPLNVRQAALPPLALILGVSAFLGLLWAVLHLNMLAVYQVSNRLRNELYYSHRSYGWSMVGNLWEFFAFLGVPLTLCFFAHLWRLSGSGKQRSRLDFQHLAAAPLEWALLGVIVALELSGKSRGEVGRMWMFLTPCVLVGAAAHLRACETTAAASWRMQLLPLGVLQFAQVVVFQYFVRVWGY